MRLNKKILPLTVLLAVGVALTACGTILIRYSICKSSSIFSFEGTSLDRVA